MYSEKFFCSLNINVSLLRKEEIFQKLINMLDFEVFNEF